MRRLLPLSLAVIALLACGGQTGAPGSAPDGAGASTLPSPRAGQRSTTPRTVAGALAWPQFGFTSSNALASDARVTSTPGSSFTVSLPRIVAYGTPLVAGGRLFVMMYGTLAAYDATTGAQLWQNTSYLGGKYGTPAVVGDVLIAPVNGPGGLVGLDVATGATRWESNAVTWAALKVVDGVVFATDYGATHALDAKTGVSKWDAYLGCVTAPAVTAGALYCATASELVVVDAETGAERRRTPIRAANAISTPAVVDGRVFLIGDGLVAYDANDGHELWHAPFETPNRPVNGGTWIETSPAVAAGRVLVIGSAGLQAFDATTGSPLWGVNVGTPGTSVAVADGLVLVGGDWLLDAATGASIWSSGESPRTTSPALVDGWFYALDMEGQRLRGFHGPVAGE